MSEIKLDARGLDCPQPVILTRDALSKPGALAVRVLVDDSVQCENVASMAQNQGWTTRIEEQPDDGIQLLLTRAAGSTFSSPSADNVDSCGVPTKLVIQFGSEHFGNGDDQLGAILIRSFIKTIWEVVPRPTAIVFLNGGVRLTTDGSACIDDLQKLGKAGVDIINCGTCLDYFNLQDKLKVGRISNMFEIASLLASADRVIKP